MKLAKKAVTVLCTVLILSLSLSGCVFNNLPEVDLNEETMVLLQFGPFQEGAPTATFHTTKGDFTVILFPDEAPKTVENFVTLAKEGFYTDRSIFSIYDGATFISGSSDEEGLEFKTIYKTPLTKRYRLVEGEPNQNLYPFSGALCGISHKQYKSDSRFFVVGDCPISEELSQAMKDNEYPDRVRSAFEQLGGQPGIVYQYTVFGHVIDGLDVVNDIIAVGPVSEEDSRPKENLRIDSVEIGTFHAKDFPDLKPIRENYVAPPPEESSEPAKK